MKIRQRINAVFMGNAPLSVSVMGLMFALLLVQLYLSGNLGWLNSYFQDRLYRLRASIPKPHPDIVLVAVTDQTISRLGWPLPRQYYVSLLNRLKREGAKAVGFNILLSTPSRLVPNVDQTLIDTVGKSSHLVMPFFYDYAEGQSYTPLPQLARQVAALGNVSMYPGDVARFIEAGILNRRVTPPQVLFPMGVELARLYLGLPPQALEMHPDRLQLGKNVILPIEENGLIRINYQGPPGFFPRVSLEDILRGKTPVTLKNKIVLIGAFSPTLGDVATSPYGDQTSMPMYGTEIQANIVQGILEHIPLHRASPVMLSIILLLLGVGSGLLFTRHSLLQQYLLLLAMSLGMLLLAWAGFNFFKLTIDTGPFLCFFVLMALGQTALINLRSYAAVNAQIAKLQEYGQKLPEVELSRRLENILLALFYISQADWVAFRRFDPDKRQLQLQNVKARMLQEPDPDSDMPPAYPFESLPFAYTYDALANSPVSRIQSFPTAQLPSPLREAYGAIGRGCFLHLPIYTRTGQLYGLFELFFTNSPDEVQIALLEELRQVAMNSLQTYFQREEPAHGLIPGVEEKVGAMVRLVAIREMESAFFSTVLESTTNPVVVCDQLGEIRFYNDNFVHILQLQGDALITSANIHELMSRVFQIQPQQWQDIWLTTLHRRRQKEVQVSTERGVYHLTLTPVFGQQSEVTGVVLILTDVTKLHRQANYDKLTGLYNRRYFDELLDNEFQRCLRSPDQPFALLMLDVDHFKSF
ncbi:MAG TPA: CHASE2 domain-containing protein, partial [Candidatus Obscuribacterales bacterium]